MKCSQQCQHAMRAEGTKVLAQLRQDVGGMPNIKFSLPQPKCFTAEFVKADSCMQAMGWTRR